MMGDANGVFLTLISIRHISQPTIMTNLPSDFSRGDRPIPYGIILHTKWRKNDGVLGLKVNDEQILPSYAITDPTTYMCVMGISKCKN